MVIERAGNGVKLFYARMFLVFIMLFCSINSFLLGKSSMRWLLWKLDGEKVLSVEGKAYEINKLRGRSSGFYLVKVKDGNESYSFMTSYSDDDYIMSCKNDNVIVEYYVSGGYEDSIYRLTDIEGGRLCYQGDVDTGLSPAFYSIFFAFYSFASFFCFKFLFLASKYIK